MYRKVSDFLSDWKSEVESTLKVFNALTDESLTQKIHPDVRTLGRLAWHITQTLTEMPARVGLFDHDILEHRPCPENVADLVSAYTEYAGLLAQAVNNNWTDDHLSEVVEIYGEHWTKGFVLSVLVTHQIHHRAQMTVVMRQLGLTVPGTYGPAKEGWAAWGMPAAE